MQKSDDNRVLCERKEEANPPRTSLFEHLPKFFLNFSSLWKNFRNPEDLICLGMRLPTN